MIKFDKTSEHLQPILFVIKAVSKDQSRFNMTHVYCTGSMIVATDGHRLHTYTPEECPLEPGYYETVKKTKSELILNPVEIDLDYPDFKRITPEVKRQEDLQLLIVSDNGNMAKVIKSFQGDFTVDFNFLKDAVNMPGLQSFQHTEDTSPVLIQGEFTRAVVMPYKY
jgi:hypothetical protein